MYHKQFVAAIKVGGQILRESSDQVFLPFGSEYSVLLKNLSTRRAQARISVDGQDTSGNWFVVEPNGSIEIERFIRNGNKEQGNRFKFIERTTAIENHRGIKAEDGLVRVEYKFEQIVLNWNFCGTLQSQQSQPWNDHYTPSTWPKITNSSVQYSRVMTGAVRTTSCNMMSATSAAAPQNEVGITVPGSESNQKFVDAAWFPTEWETHTIVLHLVGATAKAPVAVPVTVHKKLSCTMCGKTNKSSSRYCTQCGTSLILL